MNEDKVSYSKEGDKYFRLIKSEGNVDLNGVTVGKYSQETKWVMDDAGFKKFQEIALEQLKEGEKQLKEVNEQIKKFEHIDNEEVGNKLTGIANYITKDENGKSKKSGKTLIAEIKKANNLSEQFLKVANMKRNKEYLEKKMAEIKDDVSKMGELMSA